MGVNDGVYGCGFARYATSACTHCSGPLTVWRHTVLSRRHATGLGDRVAEADIRLYPTLVRFDVADHTRFERNLKVIRYDYLRLHKWLRTLDWAAGGESNGGAFGRMTRLGPIKEGCAYSLKQKVVLAGPGEEILPLD